MEQELQTIPEKVIVDLRQTCVTSMVKMSQIQNGLKHASFKDYRRYCIRKIRKMRKNMNLKYGKKRKVEKIIGMNRRDRIEAFWVPLYHAERYWSNAMELKQDVDKPTKTNLLKVNIKSKLRRAIKWAEVFKDMCEESKVERASLEAQAQVAFLHGLLHIEYEQFSEALEYLYKAKAILSGLMKAVGTIEKAHIEEKVGQIDNNIRFCKYELNEYSGTQDEMIALQRAIQSDPSSALKLEDLVSKMAQQKKEGGESLSVSYFGTTLEIQDERLGVLLGEIQIMEKALEKSRTESDSKENLLAAYINLFSVYDDAIKVGENKLKEGLSDAVQRIWEKILKYFQIQKDHRIVERNRIMIDQAISKFESQGGYNDIFTGKTVYNAVKPQNIVKLIDLNIQLTNQIKDVAMDENAPLKEIEALEDYYRTLRLFYIACFHIAEGGHQNGISLLVSVKRQVELLQETIDDIKQFKYLDEITAGLKIVIKYSKILRIKSHLTILEEEQKRMDELPEAMDDLDLEEGKRMKMKESLVDIVKNGEAKIKTQHNEVRPFVSFPPDPKLMPPNPILLDICYSQLQYPSIEHKIQKEEVKKSGGGLFSRFNIFG